jgi:hypothetical protein
MDPKEFITKDSGHRVTFDSGMVRDTSAGKMLWHLVTAGPLLRRWAGLLTRGAQKYSPNNWMKAAGQAELDRFRESAFRHFMQWYSGEADEDHAAAVFFNINGAEYVKEKLQGEEPPESAPPPPVPDKSYDGFYRNSLAAAHSPASWLLQSPNVWHIRPGENNRPSLISYGGAVEKIERGLWVRCEKSYAGAGE